MKKSSRPLRRAGLRSGGTIDDTEKVSTVSKKSNEMKKSVPSASGHHKNDNQSGRLHVMDQTESKIVRTIDDIPPEVLLKIFGSLTIMELIAAQCVCRRWRSVAHDKSLWKNYTFKVGMLPLDERTLRVMPALQNIDGHADNNVINIILDHVTNLNKMDCKFKPPISFAQVRTLVQKYQNLQSITLDVGAPDILQSVQVLQTSEKIRELSLHKEISCTGNNDFSSLSELTNILNIIANPRYFPKLINLDVTGVSCAVAFNNLLFVSVFTRVLTNRSHQLRSLKLDINSAVDDNVINAVNMCSRIQNLHLVFHKKCPAIIDISRMAKLRILIICMWENDDDFLSALYDAFNRNIWPYLTEIDLSMCNFRTDIIGALTKNARQLTYLRCYRDGNNVTKFQLKHIGNLSKLASLSLSYFQNISEEDMTYISHCYNLEYLYLLAHSTNITDLNPCVADMIHSLKHLETFTLTVDSSADISLNKKEIKIFISRHGHHHHHHHDDEQFPAIG